MTKEMNIRKPSRSSYVFYATFLQHTTYMYADLELVAHFICHVTFQNGGFHEYGELCVITFMIKLVYDHKSIY